jgi:hypothetical protein
MANYQYTACSKAPSSHRTTVFDVPALIAHRLAGKPRRHPVGHHGRRMRSEVDRRAGADGVAGILIDHEAARVAHGPQSVAVGRISEEAGQDSCPASKRNPPIMATGLDAAGYAFG